MATRWPATCGGHMWGHMWDHMWARTLYMLCRRCGVLRFTCGVEVRLAAPELVSSTVCFPIHDFRGGLPRNFRGAGRMTNQKSLIHQRLVSSTVCSSTHDFRGGLPRIFRGSSADLPQIFLGSSADLPRCRRNDMFSDRPKII